MDLANVYTCNYSSKIAGHSATVSFAAVIISTTMPCGPAALPDFIFEVAFFTMPIVIGIGGPYNGNSFSGSVVKCLTRDQEAVGSNLTGFTSLWSLSKTHLS